MTREWRKWVAVNQSGEAFVYENKPRISCIMWMGRGGRGERYPAGDTDGTDWENSLRPFRKGIIQFIKDSIPAPETTDVDDSGEVWVTCTATFNATAPDGERRSYGLQFMAVDMDHAEAVVNDIRRTLRLEGILMEEKDQ